MAGMTMDCRPGCGACCIALSISSPVPGMPGGKPAGVRCPQLTPAFLCAVHGTPDKPPVCNALRPSPEMCGADRAHAMEYLERLERETAPDA
jgi:Fe-S-cluster containining protein